MQNEQVEILVGPISASSGNFGNTSPDLDISVAVGDGSKLLQMPH